MLNSLHSCNFRFFNTDSVTAPQTSPRNMLQTQNTRIFFVLIST